MVEFVRVVVPLLLIVAALSGCAAKDADETVVKLGDGQQVEIQEAADDQVSDGKGAVSGVVVDEAIRPIQGATVVVSGVANAVMTDKDGLFLVPELQPGVYTLNVNGTGFLPVQTTAEVVAGDTSKVRIVLTTDFTPLPYHTTLAFDWYDEVGQGSVELYLDLFGRGSGLPPACDRCYFPFQSDMGVETFIIEATWEDSIPNPTRETEYFWALYDLSEGATGNEAGTFTNPGRAELSNNRFANDTSFAIGLTTDLEWVTFQQTAQIFVTMWYVDPAPQGWSFVAGDA